MLVDRQNESVIAANKQYRLSVVDEHTVAMDVQVARDVSSTPEERSKFQDTFRNDPRMCRIFTALGIDVLRLHIHGPQGGEIGDFTMTAAECGVSQPAH